MSDLKKEFLSFKKCFSGIREAKGDDSKDDQRGVCNHGILV